MAGKWWGGCLHQKLECILSCTSLEEVDSILLGLRFIDGRACNPPGVSWTYLYLKVPPGNETVPISPSCVSVDEFSVWCSRLTCGQLGWDWLYGELRKVSGFGQYLLSKAKAAEIPPGELNFERCLDEDKVDKLIRTLRSRKPKPAEFALAPSKLPSINQPNGKIFREHSVRSSSGKEIASKPRNGGKL